jgi:hypothetical protein
MGSCGSSAKGAENKVPAGPPQYKQGNGIIPKKVNDAKNKNIVVLDDVYLFGGSKILQFNVKTMTISNIPVQPTVPLPQRTMCEYILDLSKIVTLGGMLDGKITTVGYLWDPKDFSKAVSLPPYPKPVRYSSLAYYEGYLYSLGGETDGADPDCILTDVYKLKLKPEVGTAWEKVGDLPIKRRSANVMIANGSIYVFGGYSGSGNRSTQIDVVNTKDGSCKQEPYRLPLGVEGARMCWHGDDLLLIGGKRIGETADANVVQLDFEKRAILSVR